MRVRHTFRPLILAATICALALTSSSSDTRAASGLRLPPLVLWAWERPTDLRGLSAHTGVAFLAQTLLVSSSRTTVVPRRQKLLVDPETPLLAVTRIEGRPEDTRSLDDSELHALAVSIAGTAAQPGVRGVQVDFDATASQRVFYRELLQRLRAMLDLSTALSMTALASWCMGDAWLDRLPVDEIVPMLFQMGEAEEHWRQRGRQPRLRSASCRRAVGISLDESLTLTTTPPRVYVFNPDSWTARSIAAARQWATR